MDCLGEHQLPVLRQPGPSGGGSGPLLTGQEQGGCREEEALDRFSQVRSRGGAGRMRLWTTSHRSGEGQVELGVCAVLQEGAWRRPWAIPRRSRQVSGDSSLPLASVLGCTSSSNCPPPFSPLRPAVLRVPAHLRGRCGARGERRRLGALQEPVVGPVAAAAAGQAPEQPRAPLEPLLHRCGGLYRCTAVPLCRLSLVLGISSPDSS